MKPSKQSIAVTVALSVLLMLSAQVSMGETHATEEFESGATRPVSIALLPAHVELMKQKMIRREAQVEEAGELESYLTNAVAAELEIRGYQLHLLSADDINSDPELQELVVDADRRFGELLTNVSRKLKKQVAKRRYNAGDEMKLLAGRLGVDAIGFIRMQLIASGKGVQILNMGMGGTSTMLSVSLIDGRTSDIEAYITLPILRRGKMFGGYEDVMNNPDEEMARFAGATLDDLPAADPSARVVQSDEDVLGDLEALLDE